MDQIQLNGQWDLRDEPLDYKPSDISEIEHKKEGWFPNPIPGDIHQGLLAAGRIKDPLLALNSFDCQWTEDRSWWFRREFPTNPDWLTPEAQVVELEICGLDANASIYLNGHHLGDHPSSFYPFTTNIKHLLRSDNQNVLLVCLTAGVEQITQADLDSLGVPIRTEGENGYPERIDPRRVFVRKPQYAFGWDWGPRVATTAIGGDVTIRWFKTACIRDVSIESVRRQTDVILNVTAAVELFCDYQTQPAVLDLSVRDQMGVEIREKKMSCSARGSTLSILNCPCANRGCGDPAGWASRTATTCQPF